MLHDAGNSLSTDAQPTTPIKNHREVLKSVADLQAQLECTRAKYAAESAQINAELASANAVRRPLDELYGLHRALLERIANATAVYNDQVAADAELDAALDDVLGQSNPNGGRVNFGPVFNRHSWEGLTHAKRAVELFDRWFTRNRAKLADLEAKMTAYATANNLTYLLPVALGGEVVE